MKPRFTLNFGSVAALLIMGYLMYYLLIIDNMFHLSISSFIANERFLTSKYGHFLISGLLPVYVAFMVFGSAIVAMHLGSRIQQLFCQFLTRNNIRLLAKNGIQTD